MKLGTVYWFDNDEVRDVVKLCARCRDWKGDRLADWTDATIVSPQGTAHFQGNDADTACGIDATGERWWWQL